MFFYYLKNNTKLKIVLYSSYCKCIFMILNEHLSVCQIEEKKITLCNLSAQNPNTFSFPFNFAFIYFFQRYSPFTMKFGGISMQGGVVVDTVHKQFNNSFAILMNLTRKREK